jgi:hypothetical protein
MPAATSFPPELVLGVSTVLDIISMITAIIAIATGKSADPPLNGEGQAEFALGPFASLMAWILLPEIRIPLFDSTDDSDIGHRRRGQPRGADLERLRELSTANQQASSLRSARLAKKGEAHGGPRTCRPPQQESLA